GRTNLKSKRPQVCCLRLTVHGQLSLDREARRDIYDNALDIGVRYRDWRASPTRSTGYEVASRQSGVACGDRVCHTRRLRSTRECRDIGGLHDRRLHIIGTWRYLLQVKIPRGGVESGAPGKSIARSI